MLVLLSLAVAALLVLAASIRFGAIEFSAFDIWHALLSLFPGQTEPSLDQRIFLELRLPRAVLCMLVGASLGVANENERQLVIVAYMLFMSGVAVGAAALPADAGLLANVVIVQ